MNLRIQMFAPTFGLLILISSVRAEDAAADGNWPQWRGPLGTGAAPGARPPLKWGPEENVQWKITVPGHGSSSPIVWGEKVFVLSAEKVEDASGAPAAEAKPEAAEGGAPGGRRRGRGQAAPSEKYRFLVICINRSNGETLWRRTAIEALPHEGHHPHHGYASPSPVTDGKRLIAFFGSRGIFAYDMDGNKLWERDLGDMQTRNGFGEGASPALHNGMVFVQWDHEGADKFFALDADTGEIRWQVDRDEPTTWSTPQVAVQGGVTQVIANATNRMKSYNAATGEVVWSAGGQTVNVIPSPVIGEGVAYCMSGFRGAAVRAVKLEARGDLAEGDPGILWKHDDATPYVPSPLLYDHQLYFLSGNKGVLSVLDSRSGAVLVKPRRLEGMVDVYASPVGAAGRIYITDRDGSTVVLDHGPEAKVLGVNTMGEPIDASPALAGEQLFLRGNQHLFCIRENVVAMR